MGALLGLVCLASLGACSATRAITPETPRASAGPRVVMVTLDGTRWQEVFRGADPELLAGAVSAQDRRTRATYGRASPDESRRALMPFLWGTIAQHGQIFGNVERGSTVLVTNPHRKSYPGYHELLCGFASPAIVDNRPIPNPDGTVLEWLNRRPGFAGAVAAYTSWDVFDAILNRARSGLQVEMRTPSGLPGAFDRLRDEIQPPWRDSVYDAFVFHAAMHHLEERAPRVLYLALGDIDEWAHAGRYDRYLDAIHRSDAWLGELWAKLQALPAYRGLTSLVVTTDHGRGDDVKTWTGHGPEVVGAEHAWVAVLGPPAPAVGERHDCAPVTLGQVAATVAALVGEDYRAATPSAAPALPLAVGDGP